MEPVADALMLNLSPTLLTLMLTLTLPIDMTKILLRCLKTSTQPLLLRAFGCRVSVSDLGVLVAMGISFLRCGG